MHTDRWCRIGLPPYELKHLRASDLVKIVQAANFYLCMALIRFDGGQINCKSLIEVTGLTSRSMTHLYLETMGPNAGECFEVLWRLLESHK